MSTSAASIRQSERQGRKKKLMRISKVAHDGLDEAVRKLQSNVTMRQAIRNGAQAAQRRKTIMEAAADNYDWGLSEREISRMEEDYQ